MDENMTAPETDLYKAVIQDEEIFISTNDLLGLDLISMGLNRFHVLFDKGSHEVQLVNVDIDLKEVKMILDGHTVRVKIKDHLDMNIEKLGLTVSKKRTGSEVTAPMPGLVLEVLVKQGEEVIKGDPLIILEAMKMENVLKCHANGRVSLCNVRKGDKVDKGQVLLNLE